MEQMIQMVTSLASSADVWLLSISGVLVALAAVAKLTKTKKDDKLVLLAKTYLDKAISVLAKLKPKVKTNK